jgi:hypothetical protein
LLASCSNKPSSPPVTKPPVLSKVTVSWTNPKTYTDGTSLPASNLDSMEISWGNCTRGNTSMIPVNNITIPDSTNVTSWSLFPYGYSAGQLICFELRVRDKNGNYSAYSKPYPYVLN